MELFDCSDCSDCSIGGWRVVDEPEVGRVGRAFVVCKDDEPTRRFVLKLWRDDQPGLERAVNAKEAERLRTTKAPQRMPKLIETGEWNGLPFFVMEPIEGVDYPIPAKVYRAFCVEAFTALEELHLAGLLHCDLTPAHLGWKNGKLAFIDFDSAHTFAEAVKNKDCIGTDPYIAPEVASRGEISKQSDMYSLAMILIDRCPEKLRDTLEPVLRECLKPEPGERPPSAAVVAELLRRAKSQHHRFKAAAKWTAIAGGVILLGLVAVNTGLYFFRRAAVERKYGDRIEMKVNRRSGLAFLERGDLTNAVRRLRIARQLGSQEAAAKLEELRLRRH